MIATQHTSTYKNPGTLHSFLVRLPSNPVFTILPYYVSYPAGIFNAQMKGQCWVPMLCYYKICCTSLPLHRLDLLGPRFKFKISNALAKMESARVYVIFCSIVDSALALKLKEIIFVKQVLLRSATLLSKRVMKQDYRSQKSSMASK